MQASWKIDRSKVLQSDEIAEVIADLKRRAKRSINSLQNLIIFRLAACCGLRASEIVQLKLTHVSTTGRFPVIRLPSEIVKNGRKRGRRNGNGGRSVPLWWDQGTLDDLRTWRDRRIAQGAKPSDYLVCSQARSSHGNRLHRLAARARFITACKVLGDERTRRLTIHDGRHTAISHWLAAGIPLAQVRDAAGHSSIATTSIYTHALQDDGTVKNVFGFGGSAPRSTAEALLFTDTPIRRATW